MPLHSCGYLLLAVLESQQLAGKRRIFFHLHIYQTNVLLGGVRERHRFLLFQTLDLILALNHNEVGVTGKESNLT